MQVFHREQNFWRQHAIDNLGKYIGWGPWFEYVEYEKAKHVPSWVKNFTVLNFNFDEVERVD